MNTVETMDSPNEALTNLMECLVLSFELSRERRRFTLVCDYPFKLPGADCALVAFVFDAVHDFVREEGDLPALKGFTEVFHARAFTRPIVIQSIKSTGAADDRYIELWFGPNFGGLQFRYGSATAYRRNAIAKEVRGNWLCRDMDSQEVFDFYEPFPDLMKS